MKDKLIKRLIHNRQDNQYLMDQDHRKFGVVALWVEGKQEKQEHINKDSKEDRRVLWQYLLQ
ncbi:MAG: hypothetical protein CMB80_03005 [Flammeovirgaceae bacterium]|nr:hypothetical protein [Flammeovirgaceae bacterium]